MRRRSEPDTKEKYRKAVERNDTGELLRLAHPGYFEDGGNTVATDDYDYNGLHEYLTTLFAKTTGIRYEIRYRRVTITETKHIWVDFTYAASYQIPGSQGNVWHHKVADNRLDLVHDGDSFRIMSGM